MLVMTPKSSKSLRCSLCLVLAVFSFPTTVWAQNASATCGDIRNFYGPYDYTNPIHKEQMLPRVEQYHFDVGVQSLKGIANTVGGEARLGGDIAYTLKAFPNHHLALFTMIRYYVEKVPEGASRMEYDPPCWFDRARRFVPKDATVVMLEGVYYQKSGEMIKAKRAYEQALAMAPKSPELNYNAGLLYVDLGEFDKAANCATVAYDAGYPLPGLRNKLVRKGVWESAGES